MKGKGCFCFFVWWHCMIASYCTVSIPQTVSQYLFIKIRYYISKPSSLVRKSVKLRPAYKTTLKYPIGVYFQVEIHPGVLAQSPNFRFSKKPGFRLKI